MLRRIGLFIVTNIVVVLTITIVLNLVERFFGISIGGDSTMGIIVVSSIMGFAGAFISLAMSKSMAKSAYKIQIMKHENDAGSTHHGHKLKAIYNLVQDISYNNNINLPEIGYYNSQEVNAFATGMSKNSSLVAFSTGLLDMMTIQEIQGVAGHEMAHILNGDMVTSTLLQGVLNTFVVAISRIVAGIIASRGNNDSEDSGGSFASYFLVVSIVQVILGFGATAIQMWYSRRREFAADRGGAYFTDKSSMIAGLRRLQTISGQATIQDNYATFKIFGGKSFMGLFRSHPPLEQRIKTLEETNMLSL